MFNLLVDGGCGFIGSNFIHYLLKNTTDINIINLDALTYAGNLDNLKDIKSDPRYRFAHADIRDRNYLEYLFTRNEINGVIHFAAETHVDRSILDPGVFVETNVNGTYNILEMCRKYGNIRFHHISTDEVYGTLGLDDPAFTETTRYDPSSPYSASKASSDHLVKSYYRTFGLPITISNCSNNYGFYQYPEKLIPLVLQNAIEGKNIPIYGDGKQVRDWIYVEDHCEAIFEIFKKGRIGETYNVGGNNQPPNIEIVRKICELLDEKLPKDLYYPHCKLITYVKDRAGHDRRYDVDTTKIERELGWRPKYNLEQGLEMTVDWYLNNQDWLENIKKKNK